MSKRLADTISNPPKKGKSDATSLKPTVSSDTGRSTSLSDAGRVFKFTTSAHDFSTALKTVESFLPRVHLAIRKKPVFLIF